MKLIATFSLIFLYSTCFSQVSPATLQAVLLYSSTKYIEWPLDELPNFEILVVGDGEVYDELVKLSKSRKVKSRNITVRKINSVSELTRCHIVFILSTNHTQIEKLVAWVSDTPTLIVSSKEGLLEKGSDLNFIQKGDKLAYQLNQTALQAKHIKVASAFTSMADKSN